MLCLCEVFLKGIWFTFLFSSDNQESYNTYFIFQIEEQNENQLVESFVVDVLDVVDVVEVATDVLDALNDVVSGIDVIDVAVDLIAMFDHVPQKCTCEM